MERIKNKFTWLTNNFSLLIIIGVCLELIFLVSLILEKFQLPIYTESITLLSRQVSLFPLFLLLLPSLALYWIIVRAARRKNNYLKTVLVFFFLFVLTLVFTRPLMSIDVWHYIGWGRTLSSHQMNPYQVAYNDITTDPVFLTNQLPWLDQPTAYGPMFIYFSAVVSYLGDQNALFSFYLFKICLVALATGAVLLFHATFKNEYATLLLAWNPVFLFELMSSAHSDALTIFFLVLAIFLFIKGHEFGHRVWSWLALLLSALVKYFTAVILPIFYIAAIKKTAPQGRQKYIYFTVFFSLILVLLLYAPLWSGGAPLKILLHYQSCPLDDDFCLERVPPLISGAFIKLLSILKVPQVTTWGPIVGQVVFIFAWLMILYKLIKMPTLDTRTTLAYSAIALALFLGLFTTWLFPWYLTPLLLLLIAWQATKGKNAPSWIFIISLIMSLMYIHIH